MTIKYLWLYISPLIMTSFFLPADKVVVLVIDDLLLFVFVAVMVISYVIVSSKPVSVYVLSDPLIVLDPDEALHPAILL